MRTAVFCFSDRGARLALRLCGLLGLSARAVHSTEKFASKYGFTGHRSVGADMGEIFRDNRLLIFVCACGIAVREIAPHLKGKDVDPAVLVMDEGGRFVIPILSGHLGGANGYAEKIARLTGAEAVVTTATDVEGRFSCDKWAAEHGCAVSDLHAAKAVSAAVLRGGDVPVSSEFELPERLPAGLVRGDGGEVGVYIGIHVREPYGVTLRLIPRVVRLGIGCRRGTAAEAIESAVKLALCGAGVDVRAVARVVSIDVKRDEPGLLEFAKKLGVPVEFYSASELEGAEGEFEESDFVRKTVGVGNVCERAAVMGGRLIIKKTAVDGVTVAAAVCDWRPEL